MVRRCEMAFDPISFHNQFNLKLHCRPLSSIIPLGRPCGKNECTIQDRSVTDVVFHVALQSTLEDFHQYSLLKGWSGFVGHFYGAATFEVVLLVAVVCCRRLLYTGRWDSLICAFQSPWVSWAKGPRFLACMILNLWSICLLFQLFQAFETMINFDKLSKAFFFFAAISVRFLSLQQVNAVLLVHCTFFPFSKWVSVFLYSNIECIQDSILLHLSFESWAFSLVTKDVKHSNSQQCHFNFNCFWVIVLFGSLTVHLLQSYVLQICGVF